MHTEPRQDRLTIVRTLRRYLAVMGPRPEPIAVTQAQADQLSAYHYLELRGEPESAERKRLWFDGHELRVIHDDHQAADVRAVSSPSSASSELHARATDPETSHQALRAFAHSGGALHVLQDLLEHGPATAFDTAARLGVPVQNCSPYHSKLADAGLVALAGVADKDLEAGKGARQLWELTDPGRLHLTQIALELET